MAQQEVPKELTELQIRELHKSIMLRENTVIAKCGESPLPYPLPPCNDSVLHVAIQMGYEDVAQEILKKYIDSRDSLKAQNDRGDTFLHDAATTNMKKLVEFLLDSAPEVAKDLVFVKNNWGENPLFKASHYGQTEMFRLLAGRVWDEIPKEHQDEVPPHLQRRDGTTILHIAILAEFFDLAQEIAMWFPVLTEAKDGNQMTALQILSSIPSAFKSCSDYGILEKCIYYCIPSETTRDSSQGGKLPPNYDVCVQCYSRVAHMIISGLRITSIPIIARLQTEKRRHESAVKLARFLIDENIGRYIRQAEKTEASSSSQTSGDGAKKWSTVKDKVPTILSALFSATSNRIVEVVNEILTVLPEAVEHINEAGQNILHLAIKHRQSKIFDHVRKMELPTMLLVRQIDEYGYTILHQVGLTEGCSGGSTKHGPVSQMQKEVQWFERVQKLVPPHYKMYRIKLYKEPTAEELSQRNHQKLYKELTAEELFQTKHQELLAEARKWLLQTSNSCSTVAILLATVAFVAAYNVSGGSDQATGFPILLHNPFFFIFSMMDVLSFISSLTSLVMFLSIMISPFQLQDFRHSLPKKLQLGFVFLFFSVAVTVLAFAATIALNVKLTKQLTTALKFTAAFLPVTFLAFLLSPLLVASLKAAKFSLKVIMKILANFFLLSRFDETTTPPIYKAP